MFAFHNLNSLPGCNNFNFVFLCEKKKKTYGLAKDLWVDHAICHIYWSETKLLNLTSRKSVLAV
jgi:hypothetical protein